VYESGCTNWDTADVYLDSEELLGKWYASLVLPESPVSDLQIRFTRTGKRSEIFLGTKFGHLQQGVDGSPEYMRKAITQSLQRLQSTHVALY
jgi:aryl-alcohol dehydrogenase-like predicted oxidoreductase